MEKYRRFVMEDYKESPWRDIEGKYFGDREFIKRLNGYWVRRKG
jgi:hypothetical protein